MTSERWIWISLLAAVLVDCRGQYIGASSCGEEATPQAGDGGAGGSAGKSSGGSAMSSAGTAASTAGTSAVCPVCECGDAGNSGASGSSASQGGQSGGAGDAGAGGAGPDCSIAFDMPVPDVAIGFEDCDSTIKALISPHYLPDTEISGTTYGTGLCGTGYNDIGNAAYFDGSTRYVVFPSHRAFDLEHDATISVHVKVNSVPTDGAGAFGRWYGYDQYSLIATFPSSPTWRFEAVEPWPETVFGQPIVIDAPLELNTWQHLVVVVERRRGITFYVDGEAVATTPVPRNFAFLGTDKNFVIGRMHEGAADSFDGAVDELRIWHTAFQPEEVKAIGCTH